MVPGCFISGSTMLAVARAKIMAWADRRLVPGWRRAYTFFSIQSAALQAAVLVTWATLPDDMKTSLPSWLLPLIAGFVLVVGVIGRLTHQSENPSPVTKVGE